MGISIRQKGNFQKTKRYLSKIREIDTSFLDYYGKEGVNALASATPVNTGKTASSWYYEIEKTRGKVTIRWKNSNVNDGVNIAIILQYGHGTGNGGYVEGRDYINPAIRPIFDKIADRIEKEVSK